MSYKIEPFEYDDDPMCCKPYVVKVNGILLMRGDGKRPRRFKDSFSATVAAAKVVDKMRAALSEPGGRS